MYSQPNFQGQCHCKHTSKKKNSNKYKNQLQKIEKKVGMKCQKANKQE